MSSSLAATGPPVAIGLSSQGRPIRVTRIGAASSRLRVLMFGGQHGDEPLAREAVRRFAGECRGSTSATDVQLALIADANPDGAAARTRTNANGIDLNRDHQLLRSPETQALHRFVRRWQPHLIVDVHTYPPRRKHLLEAGLVHCHDVFLDAPTNPAIRLPVHASELLTGIDSIVATLHGEKFLAARYVLIRRSGRIRHSTPDVIDARNMFALRYGIPTILLEGRQPSRRHDPSAAAARTVRALIRTLQLAVERAAAHRDLLTTRQHTFSSGEWVPVNCRYQPADRSFNFAFRDLADGTNRVVALDGRFTPTVQVTQCVQLPAAYAIPRIMTTTIETLMRHGFACHRTPDDVSAEITVCSIEAVEPSHRPNRAPRKVDLRRRRQQLSLSDYVIFPTAGSGGAALATLLEPISKYALARFEDAEIVIKPNSDYPVLRCERQPAADPIMRFHERRGIC